MPAKVAPTRRVLAAVCGLTLLLLTRAGADAADERLDVTIVKYAGDDLSVQEFRSQLYDWIQNFPDELQLTASDRQNLRRVRVVERAERFESAEKKAGYWKRSDTLQVLEGSIVAEAGRVSLQSRVYLGELQRDLPTPSVLLKMPFTPDTYADTKDGHLAVLFYALAMDAERVDSRRCVLIEQLLGQAAMKLADIKKRKRIDPLPDALIEVERALGKAKARCVSR
jgi:hypothetical protein